MRGRPFERGNKAGKGRPPGSPNRNTRLQEALESGAEKIIRKIKCQALRSDPTAMRLCMERLLPVAKTPNTRFRAPAMETAEDLIDAVAAVVRAVAGGRLSPKDGESVTRIIESQRRMIETEAFDARLRVLETARPMRREDDL